MIRQLLARLLGGPGGEAPDWEAILASTRATASQMAQPAVALAYDAGAPVPDAPVSSIGGRPSLPPGERWPEDKGRPMLFLLQINYADMPPLPGYPESGLLSVFVRDEDVYGCDFPSRDQTGFRTIYHPDPTGFERAALPEGQSDMHVYGDDLARHGAPLTGTAASGSPTWACYYMSGLTEHWPGNPPRALEDAFFDGLVAGKPGALYYGGHPDFTQDDFRRADDRPALTEVILQMGFVHDVAPPGKWGICWGDAGEMCLMLSAADLQARRFEATAYNWDCG